MCFQIASFAFAVVDYLSYTLDAIAAQLPTDPADPMYNSIHVYVMNNQAAGEHTIFERCKAKYANNPSFKFITSDHRHKDASPQLQDPGSANVPGWKVRKQTRDIATLMNV